MYNTKDDVNINSDETNNKKYELRGLKYQYPYKAPSGDYEYKFHMSNMGLENKDWKWDSTTGLDATYTCDNNWGYFNADGSLYSNDFHDLTIDKSEPNVKFCKLSQNHSKVELMKYWNNAKCISDYPTKIDASWWNKQTASTIQSDMNVYHAYATKDYNIKEYSTKCFGGNIWEGGSSSFNTLYPSTSPFTSQNGTYTSYINNGYLNIYKSGVVAPVWQSSVSKTGGDLQINSTTGELSIKGTDGTSAIIASAVSGLLSTPTKRFILVMQNNGNLELYCEYSGTDITVMLWNSSCSGTVLSTTTCSNTDSPIQQFNIKKNKIYKTYQDFPKKTYDYVMGNDTFDPKNKLNAEDSLFLALVTRNNTYCSNKDISDADCKTYYTEASGRISKALTNTFTNT